MDYNDFDEGSSLWMDGVGFGIDGGWGRDNGLRLGAIPGGLPIISFGLGKLVAGMDGGERPPVTWMGANEASRMPPRVVC